MALVACQVEGCPLCLYHVCQGEHVIFNYIDFDRGERKICRNCVDKIQGQGKLERLKNVGDSTLYRIDESQ